jgi:hypothetical protein
MKQNLECCHKDNSGVIFRLQLDGASFSNDTHQAAVYGVCSIFVQVGHEAVLLHDWLDCCTTESGILVAKQHLARPPQLVRHMVEEWLDRYRNLAEIVQTASAAAGCGSSVQRVVPPPPALSSDSESDDE